MRVEICPKLIYCQILQPKILNEGQNMAEKLVIIIMLIVNLVVFFVLREESVIARTMVAGSITLVMFLVPAMFLKKEKSEPGNNEKQ